MHFLLIAFLLLHSMKLAGAQSDTRILCQQYENATTLSGRYTFSADQWGLDSSGFQCMNVSLNDAIPNNSTSFSATWQWAGTGPNTTTVHAFPHVDLNSASLPLQLGSLHALQLTASWALGSNNNPQTTSISDLSSIAATANVALDMFLDADPQRATSTTTATFEIMVWQAAYGGQLPVGWADVTSYSPSVQLDGATYTLYHGLNGVNQSVYTWLPSSNLTSIDADVSPLLHYLWRKEYISKKTYLGLVQWGSEAVHSAQGHNVTFQAEGVSLAVEVGTPQESLGDTVRPDCALVLGLAVVVLLQYFAFL